MELFTALNGGWRQGRQWSESLLTVLSRRIVFIIIFWVASVQSRSGCSARSRGGPRLCSRTDTRAPQRSDASRRSCSHICEQVASRDCA